ncbi:glycosyltransferase [Staphylococcus chromogenes]|nr:glycosyltransferase [Staphylococcus chromogenes]
MNNPLVTVIVPTYNAAEKLSPCFQSLVDLRAEYGTDVEVLFVDDCSTDDTFEIVKDFCRSNDLRMPLRLQTNSGSPSQPRNEALKIASGEFVFFLDADDEVLVDGMKAMLAATEPNHEARVDVVRGTLIRDDGVERLEMNTVPDWDSSDPKDVKISKLISAQSTTVPGLIRRSLLNDNNVNWRTDIRMGEDTIFLTELLMHAEDLEYVNVPTFVYNTARVEGNFSSTQQYSDRELQNHLQVWTETNELLKTVGVSYLKLRGTVALRFALESLIRNNIGGIEKANFVKFSDFVNKNWDEVSKFDLNRRLREILDLVKVGDYRRFSEAIKARLVIAGYDLKFIKAMVPGLSQFYNVQIDEWTGHASHDVKKSKRLIEWAEIIHCEWILGNAVWYSQNKRPGQRLVVRGHLFEVTREYGFALVQENIDRFIFVSLPILDEMVEKFGFDRSKVRMIPNFIDVDAYQRSNDPDRVYNLAIVGIVPARKGFNRALSILSTLRQYDDRYNLTIYGKGPKEFPWVMRDDEEAAYYQACDELIEANSLTERVVYSGWTDLKEALADKGFVLSVSDFESFHVAPAECFAAGNIALFLPWPGVGYIYPEKYICEDVEEITSTILALREEEKFREFAQVGHDFVRDNYDIHRVVDEYVSMFQST